VVRFNPVHPTFDERRYLIPFRATLLPQIFTDVLVIGGGVAGTRAALAAAEKGDVILAAKGSVKHASTYWAQGGIAAVLEPETDTFEKHTQDTLKAGGDLCDPDIVKMVVEGGPAAVQELLDAGMPLDKNGLGNLALGREGGHSAFRITHADGDATGKSLAVTLWHEVLGHERIRLFDRCFVLDLITSDTNPTQCLGAITHHPKHGLQVIWAKSTILAAGGCGMVYRESTNPNSATGDGLAMAYRAGAELMDLAFVQFHPTTLYIAGASRALITEAVRGEDAVLIDKSGYRFMPDYDDRADLAPRDVVSRSILKHLAKTGSSYVYLDARALPNFSDRFPGITKLLEQFDIDPTRDPIPVHPAAHYTIGGLKTDADGRTNIAGLYACGEAACSGLHGANRLASNSLLEGLVLGTRTGVVACERINDQPVTPAKVISDIRPTDRAELDLQDVRSSLRSVMWRHVGIERDGARLEEVQEMFSFWSRYTLDKIFDDVVGWEVQNMLTVGALITRSAQWRTESRGTHYRIDHPEPLSEFRVHDVWARGANGPAVIGVQG